MSFELLGYFDPYRPVVDMREYVAPPRSVSSQVALRVPRESTGKYLLVGARGGGKSTELRRLASELSKEKGLLVATIDLDGSGISATSVSAFDLLYLAAVSLLNRVEPQEEREGCFEELKRAYVPEEMKRKQLGSVQEALSGLAQFAGLASSAAVATGGIAGPGPAIASVGKAAANAIRLFPKRQ